eukprot:TRINITY_DN1420_c1_g1_i16.p1 TRINITY_DN1420_c1_g1~~TRINITY_DN1420_c1_g1_i16.p1  ORF type:complete len:616 (-),score=128.24 TRINITY_DN1420_c1_g1_i16:398-2245(-)
MARQLFIVLSLFALTWGQLTLERVGRVQLPIEVAEDGTEYVCWNSDLAEEVVYDPTNVIAYVGGEEIVTVIDIADPTNPVVLDRQDMGTSVADIQLCGDILAAVAYNQTSDALPGSLLIFSPYDQSTNQITQLNSLAICSEPDHLVFTPDCGKILVACSGKPGFDEKGNYFNPEGQVAIIDTTDITTAGQEAVSFADFVSFNAVADKYVARGVRYVYQGQATPSNVTARDTFSKDMEPEYVATSLDGTIGYVVLQTNNALAYLNITTGKIYDIKAFGYKSWGEGDLTLDASDKDGEISMKPWMIRSLYTPDIIDVFEFKGKEYIVTANEGDAKELSPDSNGVSKEWTEEIDGEDLLPMLIENGVDVDAMMAMEGVSLAMALNDSSMLGSLAFSMVDGLPVGGDDFLYSYGGRSVSIWEAETLTLVWDSKDILESVHAENYPQLFNMDSSDEFCPIPKNYPDLGATQQEIVDAIQKQIDDNQADDPDYEISEDFDALVSGPADSFDKRSDNKGPEPESVVVGMVGDKRILFVGNERTSTIFMFDITDPTAPTLAGHLFDGVVEGTWWEQLTAGTVAPIDPEGLIFVEAAKFPTKEPIVMVSSAVTGALYLYKVIDA